MGHGKSPVTPIRYLAYGVVKGTPEPPECGVTNPARGDRPRSIKRLSPVTPLE